MKDTKYFTLYEHFRSLILDGSLSEDSKLPSIRECAASFEKSRTTVETAYDMLAADGYIISKPQSGFYVCAVNKANRIEPEKEEKVSYRFDLSTPSADKTAFNFTLWRKYVKGALRFDERLLSYGEVQGESDLRQAICDYVKKERGVFCSAEQIVVAAGTQSLIGILCAMLPEKKSVLFAGSNFIQGKAVFDAHGKDVSGMLDIEEALEKLQESKPDIIYTSPSHIDRWGSVMSSTQRRKLLSLAEKCGSLLIEDDYDSEFRYVSKPISPLRAMNNGENVLYIGTFSRLLLPSIRISFMVLPAALMSDYRKIAPLFNQTASKAEQLALCSFLRDGHLSSQIKKQRRHYAAKTAEMLSIASKKLSEGIRAEECAGSYLIRLIFSGDRSAAEICEKARGEGIKMQPVDDFGGARILLNVSGISTEDFAEVLEILQKL